MQGAEARSDGYAPSEDEEAAVRAAMVELGEVMLKHVASFLGVMSASDKSQLIVSFPVSRLPASRTASVAW